MNIHDLIGTIITVILCIPVAAIIVFAAFWAIYEPLRRAFGKPEADPVFEKSPLDALPIGAPRDGGNYIYDGTGYVPLEQADADTVRSILKVAAKAKERAARNDAEGWQVLAPETMPHHPGTVLEVLNDTDGDYDGPDDIPDDDEVERPDKSEVMVDFS